MVLIFYLRDDADDFIAAHRLSDMLVKINLDDSASRNHGPMLGLPRVQTDSPHSRHTEIGTGKKFLAAVEKKNVSPKCQPHMR